MVNLYMVDEKKKYSFSELVEIIRVLRAPGGCPWDAEQTHKSIRNAFIEETYEAVDAIDKSSDTDLCEELGDVLLQILLHSQIAKEENAFDISDVISGIAEKMILRHPHVFGDVKVENSAEVLENWDKIKKKEKHQSTAAQTLKCVPMSYPALMRSAKVQKRAIKAGAAPQNTADIIDNAVDILLKLKSKTESGTDPAADYGRLLFMLAGLSGQIGIDSEQALNAATDEFINKFDLLEKSGKSFKDVLQTGNR